MSTKYVHLHSDSIRGSAALGASSTWPFRLTVAHRPRTKWMRTGDTPMTWETPVILKIRGMDFVNPKLSFVIHEVFREQISIFVVMTNWDQEQVPNLQVLGVDCTFLTGLKGKMTRKPWFSSKTGLSCCPFNQSHDFLNGNCYGTCFLPKPR